MYMTKIFLLLVDTFLFIGFFIARSSDIIMSLALFCFWFILTATIIAAFKERVFQEQLTKQKATMQKDHIKYKISTITHYLGKPENKNKWCYTDGEITCISYPRKTDSDFDIDNEYHIVIFSSDERRYVIYDPEKGIYLSEYWENYLNNTLYPKALAAKQRFISSIDENAWRQSKKYSILSLSNC